MLLNQVNVNGLHLSFAFLNLKDHRAYELMLESTDSCLLVVYNLSREWKIMSTL